MKTHKTGALITERKIYIYIYIYIYRERESVYVCVCVCVCVFANGPWDQGSIPSRVIPKTQKMERHAALLGTQYYKVRIKSKV